MVSQIAVTNGNLLYMYVQCISQFISSQKLQTMLSKTWNDNDGQVCAGLSWDRFTDVEQAKVCDILHPKHDVIGDS